MPELDELGRRLKDCDVFPYTYLAGIRNAAAAMAIALLPLSERVRVRLLRGAFERNRLPVRGFVVAQVRGQSKGRRVVLDSRIVFREQRHYWMNGIVPSIVARLMAEGNRVRPGVHYLADAVDPVTFLAELRKAGVEQSESLRSGELEYSSERVQKNS
jgi:hypothetical protein